MQVLNFYIDNLFGWRVLVGEKENLDGGGYQFPCLVGGYENLG